MAVFASWVAVTAQQASAQQTPPSPQQPQAPSKIDRTAFLFTAYRLNLQFDLAAQSLGVRGSVSVRNDSHVPQREIPLQVSSVFRWASIHATAGESQFTVHVLDSDIDHTGKVNEALVRLAEPLAPGATVNVDVAYSGRVLHDSERLERLGTPPEIARHNDWDQITHETAYLRGVGYVVWFPVSIEPALLGTGPVLFDELNAWKLRHARTPMDLKITVQDAAPDHSQAGLSQVTQAPARMIFVNGSIMPEEKPADSFADAVVESHGPIGLAVPTVGFANFERLAAGSAAIYYLPGHRDLAEKYAKSADQATGILQELFGEKQLRPFQVIELEDPGGAPFLCDASLMTPLTETDAASTDTPVTDESELPLLTYSMAHAYFVSPRLWMQEGIPWFLQIVAGERQGGRAAASALLERQRIPLSLAEPDLSPGPGTGDRGRGTDDALIGTSDEVRYRNKAVFVWWMLRGLAGEGALQRALRAYRAEQDTDPAYFEKLLENESHKDLKWFFDDWVYHDRGLPQLKADSIYARKQPRGQYLVTLTVANSGYAAAEVPVTVHSQAGDASQRVLIPGGKKAVVRLEVNDVPTQATINDGSVPETDPSDDTVPIKVTE